MNRKERRASAKTSRGKNQTSEESLASAMVTIVTSESRTAKEIMGEGRTLEKLRELLGNATHYAETIIDGISVLPMACKEGCAHCCRIHVDATPAEVLVIASHIVECWSPERVVQLLDRVRIATDATFGRLTEERPFVPCPLLEDEKCSAYDVRPLSCRGWNSLFEKPCKDYVNGDSSAGSTVEPVQFKSYESVLTGMRAGVTAAGLNMEIVDFQRALFLALSTPDALDRWLAGEDVFASARTPTHVAGANAAVFARGVRRLNVIQ